KRYVEERELTVVLAVDLSGSERFGTVRRFKSEAATELGAVLAMSAVRNNDRVGTVLFTDRVEHVVPPRKGRRHVLRIVRDLLAYQPAGRGTDLPGAIEYLNRLLSHHAIVFLISDFQGGGAIERPLKHLARQHDVVAVTVEDPSEKTLPNLGPVRLVDPETGATIVVDTSKPVVRARYEQKVAEERNARRQLLRRLAIDEVAIRTDAGVVEPLLAFFGRGRRGCIGVAVPGMPDAGRAGVARARPVRRLHGHAGRARCAGHGHGRRTVPSSGPHPRAARLAHRIFPRP